MLFGNEDERLNYLRKLMAEKENYYTSLLPEKWQKKLKITKFSDMTIEQVEKAIAFYEAK